MTYFRRVTFGLVLLLAAPFVVAQTVVHDANITFTTIDVPGAGATNIAGINTVGAMVGEYAKTDRSASHSFLFSGGNFTFFDYPGVPSTRATGINDSGLIVGYTLIGSRERGFFYDGTTFTPFRDGHNSATVAWGINNADDVVGGAGSLGATQGFELHNGHFKDISPPGDFIYVYATGINNLGKVVGWTDSSGFAYSHGKYKTIDFPGADTTEAWGINDNGVIVGWYQVGSFVYGFSLINGQYTSFGYPGAKGTFPTAINSAGQVVGSYTLDYNTYHGFVTSPITSADSR